MVSFGGVKTLQLFDLDTISLTFGVFSFSAISIVEIDENEKTPKVNEIVSKSKS